MIRWVFFSRFDPIRSTRSSARVYPNEEKKPLPVTSSPTYARNQPAAVVRVSSVARARFCRRQSSSPRLPRSFVRSNCSNNEKRARSRTRGKSASPDPSFVRTRPIDRSTALGRAPAPGIDPPPLPSPRFDGSRFENQNEIISIRDRSIDRSIARTMRASPTKLHMSDCSYRKNGRVLSFNSSMG
jgi:hypothetical protein